MVNFRIKYKLKIVNNYLGRVGKTSIISRYFSNKFNEKEEMTVNPCYVEKKYIYKDKTFKFSIWVNKF
jgi:GTPase SAR1 family protein